MKPIGTHNYFVYITTNPGKSVLYTGVTNDLKVRIKEHQSNKGKKETFAGRYYCYKLIYFEHHDDINIAIEREKEIKDLSREKKIELIKRMNPKMNFLIYDEE
jgi:putative endonuclease